MFDSRRALDEKKRRFRLVIALCVTATGGITSAMQPLLLGALREEGVISAVRLGQISTVELLAIAVSSAILVLFFRLDRPRRVATAGACLMLVSHLAVPVVLHELIIVVRAFAGLGAGLLMWVITSVVASDAHPSRVAGTYIFLQTLLGLGLSSVLGVVVLPAFGAGGGYVALGMVAAAAAILSRLLPTRDDAARPPLGLNGTFGSGRALAALMGVMAVLGGMTAIWVYNGPMAGERGFGVATVRVAVVVAIACQMAGSLAALSMPRGFPAGMAVVAMTLLTGGVGALLLFGARTPDIYIASYGMLGFAWMFMIPFVIPFLLSLDPTGRIVMMATSVQVLGNAGGPFLASFVVAQAGAKGAPMTSLALVIGGLILFALAVRARSVACSQDAIRQSR
ncbi:hypothetical protein [Sphingomonas colocasiae]|uniref:MFS transporter n=1 Tax=Sphingomonas colocasiae TaxID=1848973 RepID=A0ABS7PU94_9SPHN|nr:hypothetical protein [Sphingomonas colocasiae]MBY8824921.1 hypothetical protein [Sphingomonas colocasiae]